VRICTGVFLRSFGWVSYTLPRCTYGENFLFLGENHQNISGDYFMSEEAELTSSNFDSAIAEGVTLVDFWAEWCGPCRMIAPVISELAEEYAGKVNVGKINVDNETELAQRFNVSSIPSLIIFKNGDEINRFIGVTSKTELAGALDAAGAAPSEA